MPSQLDWGQLNGAWAVAAILLGYLVGAIPTAYLVVKRLKGIDIREHGSGNVGATNVKRIAGSKAGTFTLAMDFLKGALPVLAACLVFTREQDPRAVIPVLVGLAAIIGHSRSVFIGFKGGKSVITSLGVLMVLEPLAALIVAVIAIAVMKVSRIVSIGSMVGALLMPAVIYLLDGPASHVIVSTAMGLYVIYLHRANIARLLQRQENTL